MGVYIANHAIRHDGKLFRKGEEIKGVPRGDLEELMRHRAVTHVTGTMPDAQEVPVADVPPAPSPAVTPPNAQQEATPATPAADNKTAPTSRGRPKKAGTP